MPGPASESKPDHARQVGVALDDGRGVGGHLLDVGAGSPRRPPPSRPGSPRRARRAGPGGPAMKFWRRGTRWCRSRRLEARLGVVAALVLAVLVAEVVPVGAEVGEPLGLGRSPSVTTVGTFLSMHLSTSAASASSQPPTTITPAGFLVHSASTVVMKAREVDRGRAGDADLDVERLARRLRARDRPARRTAAGSTRC